MGFDEPIDVRRPLSEVGLDSLMAVNVARGSRPPSASRCRWSSSSAVRASSIWSRSSRPALPPSRPRSRDRPPMAPRRRDPWRARRRSPATAGWSFAAQPLGPNASVLLPVRGWQRRDLSALGGGPHRRRRAGGRGSARAGQSHPRGSDRQPRGLPGRPRAGDDALPRQAVRVFRPLPGRSDGVRDRAPIAAAGPARSAPPLRVGRPVSRRLNRFGRFEEDLLARCSSVPSSTR